MALGGQNDLIGRGIGADDHLRALAGRCEAWRLRPRRSFAGCFGLVEFQAQPAHGAADRPHVFLWCELSETFFPPGTSILMLRPVGIFAGLRNQGIIGFRNRLQMDVAAEMMLLAQLARHAHHLLHGVVGAADDAGREKQSLDVIAAIEVECQLHDFIDGEARSRHIAGRAVDAIKAVVIAGIGQQHLQQRNAASIRRVGMTDAHAGRSRAHAFAVAAVPLLGAAGGAGSVIFRGISQDFQLALHVHALNPFDSM